MKSSETSKLQNLDRKYLWHPFTQQREWVMDRESHPLVIHKGKGIYLYDTSGKKYIDGVSSLWANIHGHRHPDLDSAVTDQLGKIAHSTFLGLTHEPGIRLAEELVQVVPKGLSRVFFSDDGSTAIEVALKMAFQYHTQTGYRTTDKIRKSEFVALKQSYHGDTIGSVSAGGIDIFHKKFRPLLFKTRFAMSPHCFRCPHRKVHNQRSEIFNYMYRGEKPKPGDFRKSTGCRWECLGEVETIFKKNRSKIAAAVIEPVVQGAGGILVMPPGYLRGFADLCRRYNILWIADEVATGFGRTGKMFACEHENVQPDFLCLAKGISGGYLPLAATVTTEKIYRAFLGNYEEFKTFFHGHTYTANPLACAVGRESLKIIRRNETLRKVMRISETMKNSLHNLLSIGIVGEIRQAGLMAGIEIVKNQPAKRPFPLSQQIGKRICAEARKFGILLRPLGNVIVLMPPLIINDRECRILVARLKKALDTICHELSRENSRSYPKTALGSEIADFEPSRSFPRRAYSVGVCKPRETKVQANSRNCSPKVGFGITSNRS